MIHKTSGKKKKGQSTVEYIILIAAVLAALIIFLGPGGPFQTAYNTTINSGTDGMEDMADRFNLPDRIYPSLSVASLLLGPGIVFICSVLSSLYPALKLLYLSPVSAMRAA